MVREKVVAGFHEAQSQSIKGVNFSGGPHSTNSRACCVSGSIAAELQYEQAVVWTGVKPVAVPNARYESGYHRQVG